MEIREGRIEDAHALATLHAESWRAAFSHFLPAEVIEQWNSKRLEQWEKNLNDTNPWARNLICDVDGEIAGFTLFGACRDDGTDKAVNGELYAIYLAPKFWRQGIGTSLWKATRQRLLDAGFHDAALWAFEVNHRARRFYEKLEFELQPQWTKDLDLLGHRFPEVRYWQALSRA